MTNWLPHVTQRHGPVYRAIADVLAEDIAAGRLAPGTRLPTHRDLAFHLKVTVGTVTRAYAEAERRGLIGGEVGRGTFVLAATRPPAGDNGAWPVPAEPALVNMTVCMPFGSEAERAVAATVNDIAAAGQMGMLMGYGPHAGFAAHRLAGAQWMKRQHGVDAAPETVLVTLGAQNATAVAAAAVARAGDLVVTERLTYHGVKAVCSTLGLHLEGLAMDDDGLLPDAFDSACRRLAPKALYTIPTLHNPTTTTLSAARRSRIADIARQYGVTIIEDDVFGFLAPGNRPIQTLAPDITIYICSLSKSIAAGLRVGYLVAPPPLVARLESTIRAFNYAAPPLLGEIATRWIHSGQADRLAGGQRDEARARQALALDLLPRHLIGGHPLGQHLWLNLPEPWRREDFVAEARRRGVAVTGADAFAVGRVSAPHAVRIGLGMPRSRQEVTRGLQALADVLADPADGLRSIV